MRAIGLKNERKACEYLKSKGYEIIENNFSIRGGEIDIIARQKGMLIFAEVKYRKNDSFGAPYEFADKAKMKRVAKAAIFYMKKNFNEVKDCRFDIIAIGDEEGQEKINHFENVFLAEDYFA